jgi:hypothetical protein
MAPFERIVRVDQHGLLPYQDGGGSEVRNGTVKRHMTNILAKLGANDRTHAVTIGLKREIIEV